jgi:hypothetical protein
MKSRTSKKSTKNLRKRRSITPKRRSPKRRSIELDHSPVIGSKLQKNCIERSNIKLKYFQVFVVKFISDPKNDGLLIAHQTGLGKTLSSVAASQGFLDLNPNGEIVFVSPKSLINNFKKELGNYGSIGLLNEFTWTILHKQTFYSILQFDPSSKHPLLCSVNFPGVAHTHSASSPN